MGKVRCEVMSSADYAALDTKNPEKLYFVNQNGDFGPENMEAEGLIYLGDKLLTPGGTPFNPADPMANRQGAFFVQLQPDSTTSAWKATLNSLTSYYVGLRLVVFNSVASTTTTTLNVNQLGAIPIKRYGTTNMGAAINANSVTTLTYAVVGGDPFFIQDSYVNSTYNLARHNVYHYGYRTGPYGHFYNSICAFTNQGLLSSLTTTGQTGSTSSFTYNRQPVGLQFPIGTRLLFRSTYAAPNTQHNDSYLYYDRYDYIDLRYSMGNYDASRIPATTHNQYYLKVSVNQEARTWTPVRNEAVNDHIVLQTELEAGCFYIRLGNSYSATKQNLYFHPDPEPAYYDGARMVPYSEWLNEQLADVVADLGADVASLAQKVDDMADHLIDLGGLTSVFGDDDQAVSSGRYYIHLPEPPATGAILDFDLHLTLSTKKLTKPATLVEAFVVMGHYETPDGKDGAKAPEPQWVTDAVVATGEASLPAESVVNLALTGTFRDGQSAATHVGVGWTSGGGVFIVRRHTYTTGLDRASQLRVRTFTPVSS